MHAVSCCFLHRCRWVRQLFPLRLHSCDFAVVDSTWWANVFCVVVVVFQSPPNVLGAGSRQGNVLFIRAFSADQKSCRAVWQTLSLAVEVAKKAKPLEPVAVQSIQSIIPPVSDYILNSASSFLLLQPTDQQLAPPPHVISIFLSAVSSEHVHDCLSKHRLVPLGAEHMYSLTLLLTSLARRGDNVDDVRLVCPSP